MVRVMDAAGIAEDLAIYPLMHFVSGYQPGVWLPVVGGDEVNWRVPGYVWLNPPYSDITPFVKKAAAESANQIGTVMLVPSDTSVGWFKEAIQTASEVRFITAGRLAFINPVTGKPVSGNNKGSMLIIWRPYPRTHCHFATVDRDELMAFGVKLLAHREAA